VADPIRYYFDQHYPNQATKGLHQSGMQHAGIIWGRATKHSIGELIQLLFLLHETTDHENMRNKVEYL
jgi:hypothetical protein